MEGDLGTLEYFIGKKKYVDTRPENKSPYVSQCRLVN